MEEKNTVVKYVVAITDKDTNVKKYFNGEAASSYVVITGVKLKKKNFCIVNNANDALTFSTEESANKYRKFILEYRSDLLESFTITIEEINVPTIRLSEYEVKVSFLRFIDKLNDWHYSNGDKGDFMKYISDEDNVVKLNEIARRLRVMKLPNES